MGCGPRTRTGGCVWTRRIAKLEAEVNRGPAAYCYADDQRWTPSPGGRAMAMIGRFDRSVSTTVSDLPTTVKEVG